MSDNINWNETAIYDFLRLRTQTRAPSGIR